MTLSNVANILFIFDIKKGNFNVKRNTLKIRHKLKVQSLKYFSCY